MYLIGEIAWVMLTGHRAPDWWQYRESPEGSQKTGRGKGSGKPQYNPERLAKLANTPLCDYYVIAM